MTEITNAQQGKAESFLRTAQGILQRKCACGHHVLAGGCAECSKNKNGLQRKLTIGASNDQLEQDADQVADQVMRIPNPQLQSPRSSGGWDTTHRSEHLVQTDDRLQTQTVRSEATIGEVPGIVHEVLRSPGQPLDPATRAFMEPRFAHDFSGVRIHSGAAAEQSALDMNATAYTVGHQMVFGAGRLNPQSTEGRNLLAHELAHVVQQEQGTQIVQRQATALSAEAERQDLNSLGRSLDAAAAGRGIPSEGWSVRQRHTRGRIIGPQKRERTARGWQPYYPVVRLVELLRSERNAERIERQLANLETTGRDVDRSLVMAIAVREFDTINLFAEGSVSSFAAGGLDDFFRNQATPRQAVVVQELIRQRLIPRINQLLQQSIEPRVRELLEENLRRARALATNERLFGAFRRRGYLPADFPELERHVQRIVNEVGGLILPASLPADRIVEAVGAQVFSAENTFMQNARRIGVDLGINIEDQLQGLSREARRFWTMIYFGGAGSGNRMLQAHLRATGDLNTFPAAPGARTLTASEDVKVARALTTVTEAEALDPVFRPPQ